MATNYPSSLDTSTQQPTIAASDEMDDSGKEHDVVHTNHSGAIIALETKLGTGDSNATANAVLMGTGSGTSEWDTSPTFKGAVTVGEDDTGHDVVFHGATAGDKWKWDESSDAMIVEGHSFLEKKVQTGATSFTQEPWANSTISLGSYGGIGTQGSYRTTMSWNYERGADNNFHHLDVNSYPQAGDFSIGNNGFIFNYHDDYENNHTTNPPAVANITKDGQLNAYKEGADGGIVLGRAFGGYVGLRTANMAEDSGDEYVIMSNGQHTFISAGGGTGNTEGDVYIRAGGNDSSCQIFLDTSENEIKMTGTVINSTVPAFRAYKSGTSTVTATGATVWICDTEVFDNGNNFNTSTGKFYAPVDGYYFFSWHMFMHTGYDNDTDTYFGFVATGDSAYFNHGDEGVDGGQSISALFHLDAGDVCYPYIASSKTLTSYTSSKYNAFQGWLVG